MNKLATLWMAVMAILIFAGCAGRRALADRDHDGGRRHHPKYHK